MPTFTDASLIAAGTGILLWAVLATDARPRTRTWAGLAGFVALEAATFVRYTDIVVLGCAAVAVIIAWRLGAARLPTATLGWWLGSVAVFVIGTGIFDDRVYGGPLTTGYQPGEIRFGLGAIAPNLRSCRRGSGCPRRIRWPDTPTWIASSSWARTSSASTSGHYRPHRCTTSTRP
jgi:hypothetical protein